MYTYRLFGSITCKKNMLKIVFCILRAFYALFSAIKIYELNLNIYMFEIKHIFMKNTEIKKFKLINSKHYFYAIKYY